MIPDHHAVQTSLHETSTRPNLATFYYWVKKLRQQRAPQRLHPVVVEEHANAGHTVILCLPNGLRAELPAGLSSAQIRHWIEALQ
ncbi:IS66 family insertion sequence element accessory protein TnpA [Xenorhabdus thailandensis]|uniref:IS66 family insertion sequence element accessory protein TnpA n=1 Tax=Xenorhabdus thailandensis TaxID=3136255 RepID=UPI0030F3D852